jgi:hypothetical protein
VPSALFVHGSKRHPSYWEQLGDSKEEATPAWICLRTDSSAVAIEDSAGKIERVKCTLADYTRFEGCPICVSEGHLGKCKNNCCGRKPVPEAKMEDEAIADC